MREEKIEEKPFVSSFRAWIRVVALIVAAVFLPEQVAQAVEYDWRVLWQQPAVYAPAYLKDTRQLDIPLAVRNILKDVAGKPVNVIKISPTLSIELEKPLNISKERIDEIYQWLKGRPCGSKALYDYLQYVGVSVQEQDVAVMALTIDILNDVVKPEGEPEVIKNSLYALSKASEFFGKKLYPVKIDLNAITQERNNAITPFIAHLEGDHYVLVTKITDDKVYYSDEHKEEFLPIEKFLEGFSGYALVSIHHSPFTNYQLLSEKEAKSILGARSSKGRYPDLGPLFEQPSMSDVALSAGITIASCVLPGVLKAGLSSATTGAAFQYSAGQAIESFAAGAMTSTIGQAATTFAVKRLKMSPEVGQIFGSVVTGAVVGGITSNYKPSYRNMDGSGWVTNHPVGSGVLFGGLKGGMISGGTVLAQKAGLNPQLASFVGGTAGYLGFNAVLDVSKVDSRFTMSLDKDKDGKTVPDTVRGREMNGTTHDTCSPQPQIDLWASDNFHGSMPNLSAATFDPAFRSYIISEGVASLVEVASGGSTYSRVLGQTMGTIGAGIYNHENIGQLLAKGIITGAVSVGLEKVGGEYDDVTGKNKLGLTPLQMATASYLATSLVYSGIAAAKSPYNKGSIAGTAFANQFCNFAIDYTSFGQTSPVFTHGAAGFSEYLYMQKMFNLSGIDSLVANVEKWQNAPRVDPKLKKYPLLYKIARGTDKVMDKLGLGADVDKDAWRDHMDQVLPSTMSMWVNYTASTLHSHAVSNVMDSLTFLPKKATHFLGMPHSYIETATFNNEPHAWLMSTPWREDLNTPVVSSGNNLFILGGSEIATEYKNDNDAQLQFLAAGLRKPLDLKVYQGDEALLLSGVKKNLNQDYMKKVTEGGLGKISLRGEHSNFLSGANNYFIANGGVLNLNVREQSLRGAYTFSHNVGSLSMLDVFVLEQPAKNKSGLLSRIFSANKQNPTGYGISYAYIDKAINIAPGNKDLSAKLNFTRADGRMPAAAFGYDANGLITTQGRLKDIPQALGLALKGSGAITGNAANLSGVSEVIVNVGIDEKGLTLLSGRQSGNFPFWSRQMSLIGNGQGWVKSSLVDLGKQADKNLVERLPRIPTEPAEPAALPALNAAQKSGSAEELKVLVQGYDKKEGIITSEVNGEFSLNFIPDNPQNRQEWLRYGGRPEGLMPDVSTNYYDPRSLDVPFRAPVGFTITLIDSATGKKTIRRDLSIKSLQKELANKDNLIEIKSVMGIVRPIPAGVSSVILSPEGAKDDSIQPQDIVAVKGDTAVINLGDVYGGSNNVFVESLAGGLRRAVVNEINLGAEGEIKQTADLRYDGRKYVIAGNIMGKVEKSGGSSVVVSAPKFREGSFVSSSYKDEVFTAGKDELNKASNLSKSVLNQELIDSKEIAGYFGKSLDPSSFK